MGYWENTTYIHQGDPAAVARTLTSLFHEEEMGPIDVPPRRERLWFEPMQYEGALQNDVWGVAVFPGAPSWTLVKTVPLELLGEHRPGAGRMRLAELCAALGASAVQINVYDGEGPLLAEVSPEGKAYLSGYGHFGDILSWHGERLAEELMEARLQIHSIPEVAAGLRPAEMASALSRHLGGSNADCSDNLVSVRTLICHEPLPGTDGLPLYFKFSGPSRVRFPAASLAEHLARTGQAAKWQR